MNKNELKNKYEVLYTASLNMLKEAKNEENENVLNFAYRTCSAYSFMAYMLGIITNDEFNDKEKKLDYLFLSEDSSGKTGEQVRELVKDFMNAIPTEEGSHES